MLLVCLLNSEQKQAQNMFHSVRQIWLWVKTQSSGKRAREGGGGGGGKTQSSGKALFFEFGNSATLQI